MDRRLADRGCDSKGSAPWLTVASSHRFEERGRGLSRRSSEADPRREVRPAGQPEGYDVRATCDGVSRTLCRRRTLRHRR
jgi:hypothetical protein